MGLSNVDVTTAKEYINYLIEFCFTHSVPTKDTLLNRTEDINSNEKYHIYGIELDSNLCGVYGIKG